MKKKNKFIYYPNCSELIADFNLKDPMAMWSILLQLRKCGWVYACNRSGSLFFNLLAMKKDSEIAIEVRDKKDNKSLLRYNALDCYDDTLGYYLDNGCYEEWNPKVFPFYFEAENRFNASIKVFDGGHDEEYNEWKEKKRIKKKRKS